MTNVNYTQFSEEKKEEVIGVENVSDFTEEVEVAETVSTEDHIEEEIIEEPEIEESAPPTEEKAIVKGVVVDCSRLNVREGASKDAKVIKIIKCDTQVKIVEDDPTLEFYKIQTGGIVGFCMKEFIEIQ